MHSLPSLFVSHGAPTFAQEPGQLGPRLTAFGASLPIPHAVVILSPHWVTQGLRVAGAAAPTTIHDFGGFDPALYRLAYPAPGSPEIAGRVQRILNEAGWSAGLDVERGLDHGAWVPLRYLFPDASVPVLQVSMPHTLTADSAYALGRELAPLRHEGVLLVGSGSLTHNLYEFRIRTTAEAAYAREFADWIRGVVESGSHSTLLKTMTLAPHAERAHPTIEHLLPLMFAAGAGDIDAPVDVLEGGITHGVLAMDSYAFGRAH